jgi:hypothetical protein
MQTHRLWIAALAIFAGAASAGDTTGFVIGKQGQWLASPGAVELDKGRPVTAGSRLESKDPGSSITIAFLDGSAKTFNGPFTVEPLRGPEKSGLQRMLAAVSKLLGQDNRVAVFGISRGSSGIRSAVLQQTGRRVDLGPAIDQLEPGQYMVEFTPAGEGSPVTAKCNFDPPSAASATVPVAPGAYVLRVASASGTPLGAAMVLIASADDFDAKSKAFREGAALTASWPAATDPLAVQQFLTALLIDLQ